jgi:signal peptidase
MVNEPPKSRDPIAWIRWLVTTDHPTVQLARDFLLSATVVLLLAMTLYGVSGVWPPMVAVESGSMEPHMARGDLVLIVGPDRFVPEHASLGTGVVTYATGKNTDYKKFGDYGDVIIFHPDGGRSTPVIHRAHFWVEEDENWIQRADPSAMQYATCERTQNCPAPHDGFITKGDANGRYDQVSGISSPVRPEWISGRAVVRVPWLGYVRLYLGEAFDRLT